MIFSWMYKRNAISLLRGKLNLDVEEDGDVVRSLAQDARSVEWSMTQSGHEQWRVIIAGVNAPPRLLHPSADAIPDARVRAALDELLQRHKPHEVETAASTLVVTFLDAFPSDRWHGLKSSIAALADAVRAATSALVACPSCGAPLADRAGEASCAKCKGKLITGDVARERIFDPRNIDPGALKDASVSRGLVGQCPACTHAMAPVLVDDVVVDVCRGCGAVWCDAGEYVRLMGGA